MLEGAQRSLPMANSSRSRVRSSLGERIRRRPACECAIEENKRGLLFALFAVVVQMFGLSSRGTQVSLVCRIYASEKVLWGEHLGAARV